MKDAPKTNHKHSSLKLKKGLWSPDEDHRLFSFVMQNGITCWSTVPQHAGLRRCGKSCRLRWINYLRPDLKRGSFTADEENLIIDLHSRLGNKWSQIAARLPGRTDNDIKNFWNTHIKKKILAQTKIEGAGDSLSLYSLEKMQRFVTGLKQEPDYDQHKMFMDCNWNKLVLSNHFPLHTTSLMSLTVKENNNSALMPGQSTPPVALDDGSTACFIDEVLSDQRTWKNDEMNDSTGSKTERISKAIHGGVNVSSMFGNEAMIIASEQQHFWQDLREPEDNSDEKLCFPGKEGNALECYSSWICEMQEACERLFTELVETRVEPLSGLHVD